jgi:hypothetical protein
LGVKNCEHKKNIIYRGGHPLVELLEHMDRGVPALRDIKGLSYKDRDGVNVHNPSRGFPEDRGHI